MPRKLDRLFYIYCDLHVHAFHASSGSFIKQISQYVDTILSFRHYSLHGLHVVCGGV